MTFFNRYVRAHLNALMVPVVHRLVERDILRNINDHRARTTGSGNMKGFFKRHSQVFDVLDQKIMFHNGSSDSNCVALLECVKPNGVCWHLACDHHQGNAVHVGGGNTSDGVGHARSRSHQGNPHIARRSRVAIGRVHCSLLMTDQHVLNGVLFVQGVVNVQNGATWVAPNVFNAFGL